MFMCLRSAFKWYKQGEVFAVDTSNKQLSKSNPIYLKSQMPLAPSGEIFHYIMRRQIIYQCKLMLSFWFASWAFIFSTC